jgi:hypothetical protein
MAATDRIQPWAGREVVEHGSQHRDAGAIAADHQRILAVKAIGMTGSKHGCTILSG